MRNQSYTTMLLALMALSGCATQKPAENLDDGAMVPAQPIIEKAATLEEVTIEVARIVPLPGQLREKPREHKTGADNKPLPKPWEIIEAANKGATFNPEEYGYYNAVMEYDYDPGALYQIYAAPLKLTDIQLQPGEVLIGKPAGGDTLRWKLGSGQSKRGGLDVQHIYVKPTRPDLHTTLTVNTDRRTYHFELHSYKDTYMAAVRWRYPQDELQEFAQAFTQQQETNEIITSPLVALEDLNHGYEVEVIEGNRPTWLPVQVFDDGRKTFIQFPASMKYREAPVLFVVSEDDETQLVNYRVKNDFYVVDALFVKAELRLGQKNQTIVRINKAGGVRTASYRPGHRRIDD